ncbi:hypothetical protein [Nocardioides sp. KR10-350]|uniref:hypothetical protein n=1 Tax=Nocardioides cheoyonin TaxID=3156615 RepID=UPI0032B4BB0F
MSNEQYDFVWGLWFDMLEGLAPGLPEYLDEHLRDDGEDDYIRLARIPAGATDAKGRSLDEDVWVLDHYVMGQMFFASRSEAESAFRDSVERDVWDPSRGL